MNYASLTYFVFMFGVATFMMGMLFGEILRIRSERKEWERERIEAMRRKLKLSIPRLEISL